MCKCRIAARPESLQNRVAKAACARDADDGDALLRQECPNPLWHDAVLLAVLYRRNKRAIAAISAVSLSRDFARDLRKAGMTI